jgi:hypothetical protein
MRPTLLFSKNQLVKDAAILSRRKPNESVSPGGLYEGNSFMITIACLPSLVGCVDDLLRHFNGRNALIRSSNRKI